MILSKPLRNRLAAQRRILQIIVWCYAYFALLAYSSAQAYEPLVIENAHWVSYLDPVGGGEDKLYGYVLRGDTLVEQHTYKKLYYRQFLTRPSSQDPPYEYFKEYVAALMREDTTARKVYCRLMDDTTTFLVNCPVGEEFLLYDFSLQQGDTLTTCVVPWSEFAPYVIDVIYTADVWGKERRIFENNLGGVTATIIEGVGGDRGLFYFENFATVGLISFVSILDYCVGTDEECMQFVTDIIQDVAQVDKEQEMQLSPNPARDYIHIRNAPLNGLSYTIFNIEGKRVQEGSETNKAISVAALPKGFYFLVLNHKKVPSFHKFIKL